MRASKRRGTPLPSAHASQLRRASLRSVAKVLIKDRLKSCRAEAKKSGGGEADAMHQELLELVSTMAR